MIEQSEEEIIKDIIYFREKGDRRAEVRYNGLLAAKYKEQRKFHQAVETLLEEIQIRLSLGDSDGATSLNFAISNIYWVKHHHPIPGLGDMNRAIQYEEQAVALDSRKAKKADYLHVLSSMYAMQGDMQRAIHCSDLAASYNEGQNDDRAYRM